MTVVHYLDLDILINGGMDGFLLVLTGRLLGCPVKVRRILAGVLLGEIPVVLALLNPSPLLTVSKVLIPVLMILVSFPPQTWREFGRALLGFWLLSAGLGGFIYALWDWVDFGGSSGNRFFVLALTNLWILPLAAGFWWLLPKAWSRWQMRRTVLERAIYDLEIDFGKDGQTVIVKALLDTGNQLRDPINGNPVILVEEEVAATAIPDNIRVMLRGPWRELKDPWPLLWQANPDLIRQMVFLPFQTIHSQSWLLGIRPCSIRYSDGQAMKNISATVALIQQVLSPDGEYQALLHPEHVQSGVI